MKTTNNTNNYVNYEESKKIHQENYEKVKFLNGITKSDYLEFSRYYIQKERNYTFTNYREFFEYIKGEEESEFAKDGKYVFDGVQEYVLETTSNIIYIGDETYGLKINIDGLELVQLHNIVDVNEKEDINLSFDEFKNEFNIWKQAKKLNIIH